MKTIVLYRSMTGHSKKLARAIAEELGAEVFDAKKKPALGNADLLFLVGGLYSAKSLPDFLDYVRTLTPAIVSKAVLITSSATDKCGQDEVRAALTANGIEVLDEYRCYGSFLFIKLGHPNKKERAEVVEFAKRIAESAKANAKP